MILVTGAAGHLGHAVTKTLVTRGKSVRALVHNPDKARVRLSGIEIEMVRGDVTNPASLERVIDGVEAVVHLVAIAIERPGITYEEINYQGTLNVLEAAQKAGVQRLIHMGQMGSSPDVPYRFLKSKGMAQQAVEESDLDWTVLRPSVIFGPTDEFANVLTRLLRITPILFPVPGDGQARFQPIHVGDVAEVCARCLDDESTIGGVYELGGPEILTYDEMLERIMETIGAGQLTLHVPVPVLRPVVKVVEAVLPNPPVTTSLLQLLAVDNTTPDNAAETVFELDLVAFKPENLSYMREITAGDAIRSLLG